MSSKIHATVSNRIERLYLSLVEQLFSKNSSPFTKRIVIVPSPAMKSWVMQKLANDLGIASGVMITYLEPALSWLKGTLLEAPPQKRISRLTLAFQIEAALRELAAANEPPFLSELPPLSSPQLQELRFTSLADRLAFLFLQYEEYGQGMLKEWTQSEKGGWQGNIWRNIVGKSVLPFNDWKKGNVSVHVFGMSFLSRQQHDLFMQLSKKNPVVYYLLSPCQVLWSDLLSDKEGLKLRQNWQQKGMNEEELKHYEELLFDRNPLLANWGRVGRMMAAEMEETLSQIEENYEEFIDQPKTLLERVQADWLYLKNPTQFLPCPVEKDDSIQIHVAPSKMREVEILYQVLLHTLEKHKDGLDSIHPQDIIVMAPDVMAYEPYIRAVFHSPESQLDCQIMDLNLFKKNGDIQGFFHLLELPKTRWDVASFLELLRCNAFLKKQGFVSDEVETICKWIQEGQIVWGEDGMHRQEILHTAYGKEDIFHQQEKGTWREGIDRLLLGMAMISPSEDSLKETLVYYPLQEIPSSQQELFGKWLALVDSLLNDLRPLSKVEMRTLNDWALYLELLLEKYFYFENRESAREELCSIIQEFSETGKSCLGEYSFYSVYYHLENLVERKRAGYREKHLHAVRFCSLLPMRAVPSKVIVLMGMGEGCFPRIEGKNPLNLLTVSQKKDPCPTTADFDRYVFLESLLSCRRYFILFYSLEESTSYSSSSMLITELLSYLDQGYLIDGAPPSKKIVFRHPYHAYHHSYFEEDSPFNSYSESHFRMAVAYYQKEKRTSHSFIPSFEFEEVRSFIRCESTFEEAHIEIRQINQLARDPVGFYFKEQLGIYLKSKEVEQEESFFVSPKAMAQLNKRALRSSMEVIKGVAEKEGLLPIGPFKEISLEKMFSSFYELSENFKLYGVDSKNLFEIVCTDSVKRPSLEGFRWLVPPLKLSFKGKRVSLSGTIKEVCSEGLLCYHTSDKKDLVKSWPYYLIFLSLRAFYQLPFGNRWLFLKDGESMSPWFEDPLSHLSRYLDYYVLALENPSPLIPDWVPCFLQNDSSQLERQITTALKGNRDYFYYDALKWLTRGGNLPNAKKIFAEWQPQVTDLFSELSVQRDKYKNGKTG